MNLKVSMKRNLMMLSSTLLVMAIYFSVFSGMMWMEPSAQWAMSLMMI